jgi:hypothetical protein
MTCTSCGQCFSELDSVSQVGEMFYTFCLSTIIFLTEQRNYAPYPTRSSGLQDCSVTSGSLSVAVQGMRYHLKPTSLSMSKLCRALFIFIVAPCILKIH